MSPSPLPLLLSPLFCGKAKQVLWNEQRKGTHTHNNNNNNNKNNKQCPSHSQHRTRMHWLSLSPHSQRFDALGAAGDGAAIATSGAEEVMTGSCGTCGGSHVGCPPIWYTKRRVSKRKSRTTTIEAETTSRGESASSSLSPQPHHNGTRTEEGLGEEQREGRGH